MKIGYQASHEQFSPNQLREYVSSAEKAGFEHVLASDHIAPWSRTQDDSGFVWSWLGAMMEKTTLSYGTVTVPGYRYHPVVLAQAIATLCHMYPGRFTSCLGSGEALNEHVVGMGWPEKDVRNHTLRESVDIMRRLWRGESVTHSGAVEVDEAKLYILPPEMPTVYGAALTVETAEWVAEWADGLATVADDMEKLQESIIKFRGKDSETKPVIVKADFAYGETREAAISEGHDQWRSMLLPPDKLGNLRTPEEFDSAASSITKEDVAQDLKIVTHIDELRQWLDEFERLNVDMVVLHNVSTNQPQYIEDIGKSGLLK